MKYSCGQRLLGAYEPLLWTDIWWISHMLVYNYNLRRVSTVQNSTPFLFLRGQDKGYTLLQCDAYLCSFNYVQIILCIFLFPIYGIYCNCNTFFESLKCYCKYEYLKNYSSKYASKHQKSKYIFIWHNFFWKPWISDKSHLCLTVLCRLWLFFNMEKIFLPAGCVSERIHFQQNWF